MVFGPLLLGALVWTFLGAFATAITCDRFFPGPKWFWKLCLTSLIIPLGIYIWLIVAACLPWRIETVAEVEVQTINKRQFVEHEGWIVNVNKEFGRIFEDKNIDGTVYKDTVFIKEKVGGYYAGIWYDGERFLDLKP